MPIRPLRGSPAPDPRSRGARQTAPMARVTVVGAGVVGLTCAVRLLEDGHRVDVLARDLPLETTSAVAAALWYPYLAFPRERVLDWSAASYGVFAGLAEVAGTGVTMRAGTEVFRTPQEDPWWRAAVPSLEKVAPPPGYADAWTFLAPVVEMPALPGVAGRPGGGARRHDHPPQPLGAPVGTGRGRQRLGARLAAAGRGPDGDARARPGGARRAGRPGALVAAVHGPGDLRHPARRTTSSWAAPRSPVTGAGRRHPRPRRPSWPGRVGWCPSSRARPCCGTASASAPPGRRCASSGSATSCTATATAAPASP